MDIIINPFHTNYIAKANYDFPKILCSFAVPFSFARKTKKTGTPDFSSIPAFPRAGDERIELPPKVLETPIIPFDQSPVYKIL